MRKLLSATACGILGAILNFGPVSAGTIFLDADTAATGSNLDMAPLVTPYGTISFTGEIRDRGADPDFNAAGAAGDVFDIVGPADIPPGTSVASMMFDFDVASIEFIYGGNDGVFDIVARDILNNVVDSFFQASTSDGQPAGPVTLSGSGIRSITWQDLGNSFAPIDNVTITVASVPEPDMLALFGLGLAGLGFARRKRAV